MHHGTFRHEQGDAGLKSERGWQFDAAYAFKSGILGIELSPFFTYFGNYIYLRPTGEWSILPHSRPIYRYSDTRAIHSGSELPLDLSLTRQLTSLLSC